DPGRGKHGRFLDVRSVRTWSDKLRWSWLRFLRRRRRIWLVEMPAICLALPVAVLLAPAGGQRRCAGKGHSSRDQEGAHHPLMVMQQPLEGSSQPPRIW